MYGNPSALTMQLISLFVYQMYFLIMSPISYFLKRNVIGKTVKQSLMLVCNIPYMLCRYSANEYTMSDN